VKKGPRGVRRRPSLGGSWSYGVEYPGSCPRGRRRPHYGGQLGAGYKVYRNATVVGFVPPLEQLAVWQISPRFLSQEERIAIADLRHAGVRFR
jgi:hypothetical protein